MPRPQALFVDPKGPYPILLTRDRVWDVARDARRYYGPDPVVAHPPCQLWANLAAVNWKRYGKERPAWYPGGTDGGCFLSALRSILRYGGVLEHPASSHAWAFYGLPKPSGTGWTWGNGVWVCEVRQCAYGHRARKRTWLAYAGNRSPFPLNWSRTTTTTHQIGWFDRTKPTLGKRAASATPHAFAVILCALAVWSRL